ncbi:hypothetical protein L6R53_11595 [Myxococcota bacterium]|nr:hypothetical protein [Myxococcota bacterium]
MLLALLLCCAGPSDSGEDGATDGGAADGGAADGGASDGGAADGGGGDGGGSDGGGSDGGGTSGDCASLTWREDASVFIDTQAELASFCESWNAVRGDLVVDVGGQEDPITELDGIGCLCEVDGDLVITGDSEADGREPVAAPPHVTGDIELYALQRVGGDLRISHHPNLGYVEGLRALIEVGGDLVIEDNPTQQVASFYALQRVGGEVVVRDMEKLLILRLPAATHLGGLQVGAEGDAVTTWYLVEVLLTDLVEVTGDLRLVGARNLSYLGAPALTTVGGALHLQDTCETLADFPALASAGSLTLTGMCALADLSGFAALAALTGQDEGGHSLRLAADDHLDADEIDAFVAQLSSLGTGIVDVENQGSCADAMAAYGQGYCD